MTSGPTSHPTVGALLSAASKRLATSGVESARREARLLLAQILGCDPQKLFREPELPVGERHRQAYDELLVRRLAGVPLSRLRGWREFWSLRFALSPGTLDPRADSETLIEAALQRFEQPDAPLRILDLGTGSGCLLLALLSEYPNAWGLGIDLSPDAAGTALENARDLALNDRAAFLCGDWTAALDRGGSGKFDLVISNPPYIGRAELEGLVPEVRLHDPHLALAGGHDGLACYRDLIPQVCDLLREDGVMLLEIGSSQAEAVRGLLARSEWKGIEVIKDLAMRDRCVVARR